MVKRKQIAIVSILDWFKQTGCTITGSGYQDIYWGQLISSIAGSTQKITKIKGINADLARNIKEFLD